MKYTQALECTIMKRISGEENGSAPTNNLPAKQMHDSGL